MGGNKAGILEPEPLRMTPNSYQISKERLSKQIPLNPYQVFEFVYKVHIECFVIQGGYECTGENELNG